MSNLTDDIKISKYFKMVDTQKGTVDRKIFTDEQIYTEELKQIFKRCWLYLAHESQIPNKGDYLSVLMGTTPIIVCRGGDDKIYAHINSCRHRGNTICRADRGNTKSFTCPYHAWVFGLTGKLIGLPGEKKLYASKLDKSQWGLISVAQLSTYKGLIFATFDDKAPSLENYLGDMRWGLDILLDQGELIAVPGTMRWVMNTNWKFPSDNGGGDIYHHFSTHRSAYLAGHHDGDGMTDGSKQLKFSDISSSKGFTMLTEYGHGYNADYVDDRMDNNTSLSEWRKDSKIQSKLGKLRSNIHRANQNVFPNLFVSTGARELIIRNPIGPTKTEFRKTLLIDKNADPETQRVQVRNSNRHFGPAGLAEQDDGENWEQCTIGTSDMIAMNHPLHYGMGVGDGKFVCDGTSPPRIESLINEHYQLWMYRVWAEFMDSLDWDHLKKTHSQPEGIV